MDYMREQDTDKKLEGNQNTIPSSGTTTHLQSEIPLWYVRSRNAIYYTLGVIEVLLGLRFLFMLLGANMRSGFTAFLYAMTGILIAPFSGVFNPYITSGLVSRSVFDPATLIAMIIYALLAWGLVRLLWIKVSRNNY